MKRITKLNEIVSLERDEIARILQQLTEEMVSREKEPLTSQYCLYRLRKCERTVSN